MRVNDLVRRNILLGFTLCILVFIIVANLLGKSQDKVFAANQKIYQEAVVKLQDGQYELAWEKAEILEKQQNDSEIVNYIIGLVAANAGHTNKAVLHFQRALDLNPYKVEDPMFMMQYAEVLVMAGMQLEASIVLELCSGYSAPESFPQYQERIIELREQING